MLNTIALSYFARAYFEYMIETLNSKEPDEEFVFFLIGELYQIIYMHKGSPFSTAQTEVVKNLVQYAAQEANNRNHFEYFSEYIQENAQQFFNELSKYDS